MALTQKERSRKSYRNRKDNGLCPRCGNKLDREGHYCLECLLKKREYIAANRAFFRKNQICPECGKEKLFGDEKQCISCREKSRQRKQKITDEQKNIYSERFKKQQKSLYKERAEKGICTRCGKRKAAYGKKKCQICLNKDAEAHRIKRDGRNIREYRKQNGLCYFCGEPAEENKNVCAKCSERFKNDRLKARANDNHWWKEDNKIIFAK